MLLIKRSWKLLLKFPVPGSGQLLLSPAWNKRRIETSIRRKHSLRATYHTLRSLALINAQSNLQSVPDIPKQNVIVARQDLVVSVLRMVSGTI
jgi:hypothetical protein